MTRESLDRVQSHRMMLRQAEGAFSRAVADWEEKKEAWDNETRRPIVNFDIVSSRFRKSARALVYSYGCMLDAWFDVQEAKRNLVRVEEEENA